MLKKVKFTVFNVFIALLLAGATFFTIGALRTDRLNLNPLFAVICFVLAFGLFSIRLLIRFFFKDLKKASIAEEILLTIVALIFLFFCVIILGLMGYSLS